MNSIRRRHWILGSAAAIAAPCIRAQDSYPNKPIRWIVTYPPGGGADWLTRSVADRLRAQLGQPVLVDNRPGGGNSIGLNLLAKAPPDGYTIGTVDMGGLTMLPHLMKSIPYDSLADFQPVSLFVKTVWIWVVNPARVPANSFTEFLALAKASPDRYSFGSFGTGSITHVMLEMLMQKTGIKLLHVPYKGAAPAQQDLLGGQVDCMITDYSNYKPHEASGRMRALACSVSSRLPQMPDLPTMIESGVPGYDVANWLGVMAPAGTPAPVVERLQSAIRTIVVSPEIAAMYADRAFIPAYSTPAQLRQLVNDDYKRWGDIIRSRNITLE